MFFFLPNTSLPLGFCPCVLEANLCLYNCPNFFHSIIFFPKKKKNLALHSISFSSLTLGKFLFLAGSSSLWQYFTEAQIDIMIKMCICRRALPKEMKLLCRHNLINFHTILQSKDLSPRSDT